MAKEAWTTEETKLSDFGDVRLNNRFTNILNELGSSPNHSLPVACKGWKETLAAYRFINNEKVNVDKIIHPHANMTLKRIKAENTVLILQDTTEIDFTGRDTLSDMGYLSSVHSKGFYLHPSIAVTPDKRCLGVLDINSWVREEIGISKENKRLNKPIEEKESYCWLKGYEVANNIAISAPDTTIVNVTDREGDIYDLLEKQPSENNRAYWLIRAQHNRRVMLSNEDDCKLRLWDKAKASPVVGYIKFAITDGISYKNSSKKYRNNRKGRVVKQEVRSCRVTLKAPKEKIKKSTDITVNAVYCSEIDVPEGEKPISWLLLTTYPITDEESACKVINWYLCRWQIEIFFKILKSGCQVEKLQFENYKATLNCIAIYMIIAWRILHITMLGRECPDIDCSVVFEKSEWQSAYAIGKQQAPPKKPPKLQLMMQLIAEFGGHLGRSSDKTPGPKIMWIGIQRLRDFTIAWETIHKLNQDRTYV